MKIFTIYILFYFMNGIWTLDFTYEMDVVLTENTIQTFVDVSLDACWNECSSRPSCLSINFRPMANLCFLKNANKGNGVTEKHSGFVYRQKLAMVPEPVQCGINMCKEGETCNRETNVCEIRECSPLLETPAVTVLGNVWSVGSKAILKCQEGYVPSAGNPFSVTTVCGEKGIWSKELTCAPATCKSIFYRGITQSGTYLAADEGTSNTSKIYCDFHDPLIGYTYFATNNIDKFSLSNHFTLRDHAIIRHAQNNVQFESKIRLLPQYRDTYNISVFINENPGFSSGSPIPYMFVGFIPASIQPKGTNRGYTCFDQDFIFPNCDDNPNNCFLIKSTVTGGTKSQYCYGPNRSDWTVENGWKLCARQVDQSRNIPMEFMFPEYSVMMGGCGCASVNCESIEGMAFGLPFSVKP